MVALPGVGASCHADGSGPIMPGAAVIALVGNPNVGKSSVFNGLTGAKRSVGNWPGTTVEVGTATLIHGDERATLLDLPGAYSLDPASPDEELTRDLIVGRSNDELPDLVVVVADAPNLSRSLYLLAQLRELPVRVLVALSMLDLAASEGIHVDQDALAASTGATVVAIDGRRGHGLDALTDEIFAALRTPPPAPLGNLAPGGSELDQLDARFEWVACVLEAATVTSVNASTASTTERIDRVALAPIVGPLLFLFVMWMVFQLTTTVSAPLQDALDRLVSGPVSRAAEGLLGWIGLGGGAIEGFVVSGLIAGVGMLLTFVPVMAIMFLCLAMLENSGYLARGAVVTDRLMRMIGLPGRAFLPLVVGFGCNVPAISAARVLPDARQRLLVALVVPYTSCSARLSVYVLVATTFFGAGAGTVVFAMYVVSILFVVGVGLVLKVTAIRALPDDRLFIDLPRYQLPLPRMILTLTWVRLRGFLQTAGGIIVATVAVVWLFSAVPVRDGSFADVDARNSLYGEVSAFVAPVFAPAGFDDWHTSSALITGFVAKEAVISTWAQSYETAEPVADDQPGSLAEDLQRDFERTSDGHTTAAVMAFLVFLLAYTPCVATLAAQKREIGTRWTLASVAINLSTAWVAAVLVFQIGRLIS